MARKFFEKTLRARTSIATLIIAAEEVLLNKRSRRPVEADFATLSRILIQDRNESDSFPGISVGYAKPWQVFSKEQGIQLVECHKSVRYLLRFTAERSEEFANEFFLNVDATILTSWSENNKVGADWFT
ncbi:hypothetical protein HHI36_012248 [Cryptolaemus montrouzieri]|uniref:Transposase n=1 Tax=Cryptolaemus montrouzieri TaxID=559131 RepID=A0ABD2NDW6_9CUCU